LAALLLGSVPSLLPRPPIKSHTRGLKRARNPLPPARDGTPPPRTTSAPRPQHPSPAARLLVDDLLRARERLVQRILRRAHLVLNLKSARRARVTALRRREIATRDRRVVLRRTCAEAWTIRPRPRSTEPTLERERESSGRFAERGGRLTPVILPTLMNSATSVDVLLESPALACRRPRRRENATIVLGGDACSSTPPPSPLAPPSHLRAVTTLSCVNLCGAIKRDIPRP